MRKVIFSLLISMGFLKSWAGDIVYPVATIAEPLLKDAHVVKRAEDITFEVVSTSRTVFHYKYALTILDEAGDDYAGFVEYYDKLRKIESLEGRLYDASGKLLKKVKEKDFTDQSAVDNSSLMTDDRKKVHHFYYKVYPYTVEYEAEVAYNYTLFFPTWQPQDFEKLSVEKSRYTLICPADYAVRYRMFNYGGQPEQKVEKGKKIYEWHTENLMALKREFASPVWNELTPTVYFAPSAFEIEGYKGVMSSWQELGKFQISLNKDRDHLPEPIQQKVAQLTAGITDTKEKVKVLYSYFQQNTRYVSIQLGLGGWQPFEAVYVAQKGYGDCKALSNYMYSLLKAAGINSYYTIIRAGESKEDKKILEDFPSKQSNHIILCVPLLKDTMWLECTDQTAAPGYMGGFTGNRKALLITESGGVLVSTPYYGLKDNVQIRVAKGTVNASGDLDIKVNTLYKAMQQDDLHMMLAYRSKEEIKKELNKGFDFTTYDIKDFSYKERQTEMPEIEENLDVSISNFATISGKRLFITPNLLNQSATKLSAEERKYPIDFSTEYRDVDSVEIAVPEGYELEALPQAVKLKNKFGSYSVSTTFEPNKIKFVRIREQYAGHFPASDYKELVAFYEAMYKGDRNKLVLKKKE